MSFTSLNNSLVGAIFPYVGNTVEPNKGWFLCDGSSYLRSEYPKLFDVIGTNFGTVDSTHFNVPDLRGVFLKAYDSSNAYQAAFFGASTTRIISKTGSSTGANIGSYEEDYQKGHIHCFCAGYWESAGGSINISYNSGRCQVSTYNGGQTENYPKNVYVNFIIKY